jgi:transcriptional regulator with GAF, ATPase, and Fis domain
VAASHNLDASSLQEYPLLNNFQAFGVTSEQLAASLCSPRRSPGVVEVFFPEQSTRFTEVRYLRVLSYQIAAGLNYFKLREQTERISLEEKKLAEVSEKISASLELDELLDLIIDSLRALIPYDASGIYLLERSTKDIQRMVVYGYDQMVEQDELMQAGREALQVVIKTEKAVS